MALSREGEQGEGCSGRHPGRRPKTMIKGRGWEGGELLSLRPAWLWELFQCEDSAANCAVALPLGPQFCLRGGSEWAPEG